MALPEVNYRPEGQVPAFADPETMIVNQEIWQLLAKHYAIPRYPDGACVCEEYDYGDQPDHLVDVLVKTFNLSWERK